MLRSREEEEEEEEAIPTLRSRGLHSRGPAILAEGEPTGESPITEGVDLPATSLAQEKEVEAPQPSSPSVLMPASRVVEPSPTIRVLSGKALITETSWVQLSSSSSEEYEYYSGEEVDFSDEPTLPDTRKFSHISEEEMQVYVPAMVPPSGEIATTEGISSILLNYFSIKLERCFNISFEFLL